MEENWPCEQGMQIPDPEEDDEPAGQGMQSLSTSVEAYPGEHTEQTFGEFC